MPDIKALSTYFKDGAKFGEGDAEVTLSPSKLEKAIIDAMLPKHSLHMKVFKVADHFFIHTAEGREGEVETKATVGEFRKLAESDATYQKLKGSRSGKGSSTVNADFYRDYAIVDIDAFETWLTKTIVDNKVDVIQRGRGRAAGPKENTSGIYSLADLMKGTVDLKEVAEKQTKVIQSRINRGKELGNSRKEESKSTAPKGRK